MWYVVWVETKSEQWLKEAIGLYIDSRYYKRCWLPKKIEQQKWHGEVKNIEKILFKGYLFVDTDDPEKLHIEIKKIKCNSRVIKTGDEFTPISEHEEKIIRALTGENGTAGISVGVIENGKLKVIDGPLKGFEKYIVKIDRYKRKAWLKIKLFGEERRFNLSLSVIEKKG